MHSELETFLYLKMRVLNNATMAKNIIEVCFHSSVVDRRSEDEKATTAKASRRKEKKRKDFLFLSFEMIENEQYDQKSNVIVSHVKG